MVYGKYNQVARLCTNVHLLLESMRSKPVYRIYEFVVAPTTCLDNLELVFFSHGKQQYVSSCSSVVLLPDGAIRIVYKLFLSPEHDMTECSEPT